MTTIHIHLPAMKKNVARPSGTEVAELTELLTAIPDEPFLAAMVNHDVVSMSYPLTVNSTVEFLTMSNPHGWRVYRRSLCFLLAKAVHETFPGAAFSVDHSFGPGLYCSLEPRNRNLSLEAALAQIKQTMQQLVTAAYPIERRKIAFSDAVLELEQDGMQDKLNLLKYRNPPRVVLHWCAGFSDLAHGPLVPHTGLLDKFELIPYPPGFVLHLPERERPATLTPFEDQPHLFQIFQEHKRWGKILHVSSVGRLNEIIMTGAIEDFIMTAEALHEKKVASIADRISAGGGRKIVVIAGPSSAGKTTFAKRLATHLQVNGLRPVILSTDDYFVGPERNPRDEGGELDFEHLEAVDLALLNQHLTALIAGREIERPRFNFERKQREFRGESLQMDDEQVLMIEGIHGLNPRLTEQIPPASKFRIYVSALTQLAVDANNRISTTDNRLMRRLVRDHRFRGHPPLETFRLWPNVRRGEKRWIFPYQQEADATFNSALDYELAVLKPLVEPLLMQIKPTDPEYAEARRLSEFLLSFIGISPEAVPGTSILREYIGGSRFHY